MRRSNPRDGSRVTAASGPGVEARLVNVEHQHAVRDRRRRSRQTRPASRSDPVSILLVEDEGIVAHDLEER